MSTPTPPRLSLLEAIRQLPKKAAPTNAEADINKIKQSEVKPRENQVKTIFDFWQNHIATASMVSHATGVPHKNICRYKRDLEKAGRLFEVVKTICAHTGFRAWYCTTNATWANRLKESNQQGGGHHD